MTVSLYSLALTIEVQGQCPQFESGVSVGTLQSPLVNEASGIAASRRNQHVLWVHNDRGDSARVFAMNIAGTHLGIYYLSGADATDWEDMAIGPGPVDGVDYLYIGDIGDNSATRSSIRVYRVVEPVVDANQPPVTKTLTGVHTITLRYPDGARDAETLMVDPLTKDIYVISKRESQSRLYRAAYPQSTSASVTMEYKCSLPWGWTTSGDISPNGSEVIVRGYSSASIWQREADAELWEAFANPQCKVALLYEPQGEAICFVKDFACGFFTVSENQYQPIYYFKRILKGDLDGDCDVDMADMKEFIDWWLVTNCSLSNNCNGTDLCEDNEVNFADFAVLAQYWLFGK